MVRVERFDKVPCDLAKSIGGTLCIILGGDTLPIVKAPTPAKGGVRIQWSSWTEWLPNSLSEWLVEVVLVNGSTFCTWRLVTAHHLAQLEKGDVVDGILEVEYSLARDVKLGIIVGDAVGKL